MYRFTTTLPIKLACGNMDCPNETDLTLYASLDLHILLCRDCLTLAQEKFPLRTLECTNCPNPATHSITLPGSRIENVIVCARCVPQAQREYEKQGQLRVNNIA